LFGRLPGGCAGTGTGTIKKRDRRAIKKRAHTHNRYDGGSDAELIELFKRNRKVLGRSDEDVIAAMTRPR
jgi:hypothetical protein